MANFQRRYSGRSGEERQDYEARGTWARVSGTFTHVASEIKDYIKNKISSLKKDLTDEFEKDILHSEKMVVKDVVKHIDEATTSTQSELMKKLDSIDHSITQLSDTVKSLSEKYQGDQDKVSPLDNNHMMSPDFAGRLTDIVKGRCFGLEYSDEQLDKYRLAIDLVGLPEDNVEMGVETGSLLRLFEEGGEATRLSREAWESIPQRAKNRKYGDVKLFADNFELQVKAEDAKYRFMVAKAVVTAIAKGRLEFKNGSGKVISIEDMTLTKKEVRFDQIMRGEVQAKEYKAIHYLQDFNKWTMIKRLIQGNIKHNCEWQPYHKHIWNEGSRQAVKRPASGFDFAVMHGQKRPRREADMESVISDCYKQASAPDSLRAQGFKMQGETGQRFKDVTSRSVQSPAMGTSDHVTAVARFPVTTAPQTNNQPQPFIRLASGLRGMYNFPPPPPASRWTNRRQTPGILRPQVDDPMAAPLPLQAAMTSGALSAGCLYVPDESRESGAAASNSTHLEDEHERLRDFEGEH